MVPLPAVFLLLEDLRGKLQFPVSLQSQKPSNSASVVSLPVTCLRSRRMIPACNVPTVMITFCFDVWDQIRELFMTLLCPVPVSFMRALHVMQRPCPAHLLPAWLKSNERSTRCSAFSRLPALESAPDFSLDSDWPPLKEVGMDVAGMKARKCPSLPTLSDAVEVALEKREQKDCLVLSGVHDLGDVRKDFKSATNILQEAEDCHLLLPFDKKNL